MSEFYKQDYKKSEMKNVFFRDTPRLICPDCFNNSHEQIDCGDCDCKNLYVCDNGDVGQCCCYSKEHK